MQRRRRIGFGMPGRTRSPAVSTNGMVATSHPLAVEAGVSILKAGGNAIDAAIATDAVLGVVEPMSCGIGGDLMVIYWDAAEQRLRGLNASGRSPYAATREFFAGKKLSHIPESGPYSWSVPGCVDGWDQLHHKLGRLGLGTILEPAIALAENGFPVAELIGIGWSRSGRLLGATPDAAKTYLIDGKPPRAGQKMTNRYLAATYKLLAIEGREAYYNGPIAAAICKFSQQVGGLLTQRDFTDHYATWVEPVSTNYRGYDVWQLPPNGQGIATLQILNLLEGFDIRGMGAGSADFVHHFVEAKKLAYSDRAVWYADPEFEANLPVAELISKPYASERRKLVNPNKAAVDLPAGDFKPHMDTIYLTVVDKDRNAVSFIQSNFNGWGSGLVPGDLGFCLQNRGCSFSLDAKHANRLEPHKRPFHTIIPGFVTRAGRPWMTVGVMGGDMQPQGQAQVLCNMIDFGMNVQEAGDMTRAQHFGSQTPTGKPQESNGGHVGLESGFAPEVAEELQKRGHEIRPANDYYGGYQAIRIDEQTGVLSGGSDPRKDGCAHGY